jgi:lipopolysaccharide heptosyltransferase II
MRLKNIKKILLVNPYGIGDSLFITPLIRTLKKVYPDTLLDILIGSRTKEVFYLNPDVHHIFEYNKDYFFSLPLAKRWLFYLKLHRNLKKQNFDLMLDFSNTDEYAFLAKFFWKIPIRIGFQYRNRGRFLNYRIPKELSNPFENERPIVEHYYRLLKFLEIDSKHFEKRLHFYPDPKESLWLKSLFQQYSISEKELIILIVPGGGASWGINANYKQWPPEHFSNLISKLISSLNARLFLVGGYADQPLCSRLFSSFKSCIDLSGKTNLHQLAALMKSSRMVIGNESGPLHLATALDCKAILLYGPVSQKMYGPYSETNNQIPLYHEMPCRPCYQNYRSPLCENRLCLSDLKPEGVYQQVLNAFK